MDPVTEVVTTTVGDSILVELGMEAGFELSVKLVTKGAIKAVVPIHSKRFETTGIKVLLITLKHKQTMKEAALGFYRSSLHK